VKERQYMLTWVCMYVLCMHGFMGMYISLCERFWGAYTYVGKHMCIGAFVCACIDMSTWRCKWRMHPIPSGES
jgi:hypothetical protein